MTRLRARLRTESAPADRQWSWSQITTLKRVGEEGPLTVSALAVAEHVRPQSMAATVNALLAEGFVAREPDPTDGRKTLISITATGRKVLSSIPALREAWLETVIEKHLSPAERKALAKAAQIMERLADC